MEDKITYSVDLGNLKRKNMDITSEMAQDYFGMQTDPNQIPAMNENRDWIFNNIPDYLNIIKSGDEIIGYALLLPCSISMMNKFIQRRINESKLFEEIKRMKIPKNPEAIYLCAAFIKKEYQNKGLATNACLNMIDKITQKGKNKPILFYLKFSEEGEKVATKISRLTGLELKELVD